MTASKVPSGTRRSSHSPASAPGMEPRSRRSTVGQCTARRTAYAPPPNSFITPAMSTSDPTAMRGGTPSSSTSAGVSKAPAPIEVSPTSNPTPAPTSAASAPKRGAAAGRATNGTAMATSSSGLRGMRTQKSAGPGRGRLA